MRSLSLLLAILLTSLAPASAQDLPATAATYIGGSGEDAVEGVGLLPDGDVLVGGTAAELPPALAVSATDVLGGGDGYVARLSPDGRGTRGAIRVGQAVTDLDAGADGRAVIAALGLGPVVLDGLSVVWNASFSAVTRAARGTDGTVAALGSDKRVVVYDATGIQIGSRQFNDSFVEDVTVDAANQLVIVTGFNNRNTGQEPIQVPFIRAYPYGLGSTVWTNYNWPGSVGRGAQNPNVADSRGYRVTIGPDGDLYFLGEAQGGNTTFSFDPQTASRRLSDGELIRYDRYTNAFNVGASPTAIIGQYDAATGAVVRVQPVLARLSNGRGNSVRPRGLDIDADGRVYVVGQANASIDGRDDGQTVGGQPVAPYAGAEAFLLVIAPDFQSREAWTVFTASGTGAHASTGTSVAVRGDAYVVGASAQNGTSRFVTLNAFDSARSAGADGYVLVQGAEAPVAAFPDPNAWYIIQPASSGRQLDTSGGGVVRATPNFQLGFDRQWRFVADSSGAFRIENRRDGRGPLDTSGGGVVRWAPPDNTQGDDKLWVIEEFAGAYTIRNVRDGRGFLNSQGDGSVLWTASAGRWEINNVDDFVGFATEDTAPETEAGAPETFALAAVGPNPTRGELGVRFGLPEAAEVTVEAVDVQGRRVLASTASYGAGWQRAVVETAGLAPGVYALRVRAGAETLSRSFTVVR